MDNLIPKEFENLKIVLEMSADEFTSMIAALLTVAQKAKQPQLQETANRFMRDKRIY